MIGAFEVQVDQANASNKVLRQMAEGIPVTHWAGRTQNMPGTLVGMREWQDVSIAVDFRLPFPAPPAAPSWEVWDLPPASALGPTGLLTLALCSASVSTGPGTLPTETQPRFNRRRLLRPVSCPMHRSSRVTGTRSTLQLSASAASASYDGKPLFSLQAIRDIDTGFAAMLTNGYFQVDFDNVRVDAVGTDWDPNPTPPPGARLRRSTQRK